MFKLFISQLAEQLKLPLAGATAQYKMAPLLRAAADEYLKKNIQPKIGAVLILFYPEKEKTKLVLILRNSYDGVHSGQVSFAGGKFDAQDETLVNTALREAEEEIGVNKNDINIIGNLTPLYIPASNFLVHPFVGYASVKPDFIIDMKEVAELIEVDWNELMKDEIVKRKPIILFNNKEVSAPYFDINGHHIWGATAMIISELKEI